MGGFKIVRIQIIVSVALGNRTGYGFGIEWRNRRIQETELQRHVVETRRLRLRRNGGTETGSGANRSPVENG